jgi:hypothetical protein
MTSLLENSNDKISYENLLLELDKEDIVHKEVSIEKEENKKEDQQFLQVLMKDFDSSSTELNNFVMINKVVN